MKREMLMERKTRKKPQGESLNSAETKTRKKPQGESLNSAETKTRKKPQSESLNSAETKAKKKPQGDYVFALDIGTRTVVGILGKYIDEKFHIKDYVVEPHTKRAMVDGQVEDIKQVARIVEKVKESLEQRNGVTLSHAAIAAAGRALRTVSITGSFDVSDKDVITEELIASLEMETIQQAQAKLDAELRSKTTLFYCVGHNVVTYRLDDYRMMTLDGHKGERVEIDMVVAFLPSVVIEGLYSVMQLVKLEVSSLTLEPIAAMNVIIPQEIRLINIALVDIGAGTSDIAIAKDGAIISYAMATVAGDEITEEIIRAYLVDFNTAERMKQSISVGADIPYKDIFGFEHTVTCDELLEKIDPAIDGLAKMICETILRINGSAPAAVFLVGGGSLTQGLPELVSKKLGVDPNHVAVGSHKFLKNVEMGGNEFGAEFVTPIGIGVTAVTDRGYDFSVITVNDEKVRVFDTKRLSVFELLNMAGYKASQLMGHSGKSLTYTLNGKKTVKNGTHFTPAQITVNRHEASLTTKVTQGDTVTLKPAQSGADACCKLSDALDYSRIRSGKVMFGGIGVPFGATVKVNGEECQPDYQIQNGDVITTEGIMTLGDLMASLDCIETAVTVNGQSEAEDYLLSDGDKIALGAGAPVKKAEPVKEEPKKPLRRTQPEAVKAAEPVKPVVKEEPASVKPAPAPVKPAPAVTSEPESAQISEPNYDEYEEEFDEDDYYSIDPDFEFVRPKKEEPQVKAEEKPEPAPAAPVQPVMPMGYGVAPVQTVYAMPAQPVMGYPYGMPYMGQPVPMQYGFAQPDPVEPEATNSAITVKLNGKTLNLPENPSGDPHRFLELFNHITIDTATPKSDIVLTLNGKNANFNDTLKDGDSAIISWKEL